MKTLLTFGLILIIAMHPAKVTAQSDDAAVLNIVMHPIQNLEVNGADQIVNLNYKTREDYSNGVSLNKENHLKVYSTGGFVITVRSTTPTLISSLNIGTDIEASDITMTASPGSTNGMQGFVANPIQLSGLDATIISSNVGGNNKTFNITYSSKGGKDAYINKILSGQTPTVYSTQVIYSIEPQ